MRAAIEELGKFDHLEQIQEGANSYAFRARHSALQRDCFLKVIDFPTEEEGAILREPRSLVSVLEGNPQCDNIVRLFDAELLTAGDARYVVLQMEWLDGQSLQRRLETQLFGQQDAVRIGLGILRGVAHLHAKNLVHRDLKPSNILLTHGRPPVPKIADFGSVASMHTGQTVVSASKQSDLYRPSEGWRQPAESGYCSDLYQVALVLHQLVCGPFPTDGRSYLTKSVLRQLRRDGKDYDKLDNFEKVRAERMSFAELTANEALIAHTNVSQPYLSPQLRRIILKATKADSAQRFSSATEFLNQLSRIEVPNWSRVGREFQAIGWRDWDWKIMEVNSRTSVTTHVLKARPQSGKFRRTETHSDLKSAFAAIESISR